ncbi:MAG: VWA domain-containing protein [Thermoanaerobaculia bacterium]|nr:VWA domain-containing protein [Thermoanaerobaculia bacterium]MBP9826277.1 VWA domain-containing protein [Thermoanaerobaculia bacterium]
MRDRRLGRERLRLLLALFSFALVLLFHGAPPALGQASNGELIDVRTGFARLTVKDEGARPQSSDVQVSWKGTNQAVREVLGGPDSAIEVGIALDLSASMQRNLESMKSALREFIRSELSAADRVFIVSFSDRIELVTEGLDTSLSSIANLSIDDRPGVRPTRFFDGVDGALSHFRNSSPRAVLLVASDGCDSLNEDDAGERILHRAANLAIPVVLIAPGRRDCRNTTCKPTGSGEWACSDDVSSTIPSVRLRDRDPANPTRGPIDVPADSLTSPATMARDKFVGRLKAGGGGFLIARSDAEWTRELNTVRSLLDRQWTVVFEPSSAALQSSEVQVRVRKRSQPKTSE